MSFLKTTRLIVKISKIIPENDRINEKPLANENPDGDKVKVPSEQKLLQEVTGYIYLICRVPFFNLFS